MFKLRGVPNNKKEEYKELYHKSQVIAEKASEAQAKLDSDTVTSFEAMMLNLMIDDYKEQMDELFERAEAMLQGVKNGNLNDMATTQGLMEQFVKDVGFAGAFPLPKEEQEQKEREMLH